MQEKLILEMNRRNLHINDMAKIINITGKQFSSKLKGRTEFKCTEMFLIANFLNMKIEDIFLPVMYENGT